AEQWGIESQWLTLLVIGWCHTALKLDASNCRCFGPSLLAHRLILSTKTSNRIWPCIHVLKLTLRNCRDDCFPIEAGSIYGDIMDEFNRAAPHLSETEEEFEARVRVAVENMFRRRRKHPRPNREGEPTWRAVEWF